MTDQLAAIRTVLVDAFASLSEEQLVELTMEPFHALRAELAAASAA